MPFPKKTVTRAGNMVYLVRGTDEGRPAWHYVLVDSLRLPLFRNALKKGRLDVAVYGKVLYSGWGENPPEETVKSIKDQYC